MQDRQTNIKGWGREQERKKIQTNYSFELISHIKNETLGEIITSDNLFIQKHILYLGSTYAPCATQDLTCANLSLCKLSHKAHNKIKMKFSCCKCWFSMLK